MEQPTSAPAGRQRTGFAPPQIPTGFRHLTPAHLEAHRMAEAFAGLPPGVQHPLQLLAALKAAAPALGIRPGLVHAVDMLFRYSQPQDWEAGSRPIVWPSMRTQQHELGLGPTQVKAANRMLVEFGLVAMRDSPTGRRWGRRDPEGRITEAYGFDLSPLAIRHPEFVAAAAADRAERAAVAALRRRATIARKGIVQIIETAGEHGLHRAGAGLDLDELHEAACVITAELRRAEMRADIEAGVAALERRQQQAVNWLNSRLNALNTDPSGSEYRPPVTATNPACEPAATVNARQGCNSGPATTPAATRTAADPKPSPAAVRIRPEELVRLSPRLAPHLRTVHPDWRDIVDAADTIRHELGISPSLWGKACQTMGRERAAVAVAIVAAKPAGHFRTSPGGYFHAMVKKDQAGNLHLDRTIFGMRQQSAAT